MTTNTPTSNNSWAIRDIDGRGSGLVATRRIPAGEEIMAELPLFMLPSYGGEAEMNSELENLSAQDKKAFSMLCNSYPERGSFGIYKTNCFGLGKSTSSSAIFLVLSRANHSCVPNCERWWNTERKVETLHALRDINQDEELTIEYSADMVFKRRGVRQARVQKIWRFTCQCECCVLTGAAQVASDSRRQHVERIVDSVGILDRDKAMLKLSLQQIDVAIKCAEEEGLRGVSVASMCYDGYQIALTAKDLGKAKGYIRRVHAEYLLATGPTSAETKKMKRFVKKPKSHYNWS